MRLGTVDVATNTIIYPHHDIYECRAFLYEHKLLPMTKGGWIGRNVEGVILPIGGNHGWTAAYWFIKEPERKKPTKFTALVREYTKVRNNKIEA